MYDSSKIRLYTQSMAEAFCFAQKLQPLECKQGTGCAETKMGKVKAEKWPEESNLKRQGRERCPKAMRNKASQ